MSAPPRETPRQILADWCRDGWVPGASARVFDRETIVFDEVAGFSEKEPSEVVLQPHAFYDLASLTKPLATALAFLLLKERGLVHLEDPLTRFLPDAQASITLRHLITHTSGLPPWYPFYLFERPLLAQLVSLTPLFRPGLWVRYSCVGYMMLSQVIAHVAAQPYSRFVQQEILDVLSPGHAYLPLPESLYDRAVPTERGNHYEQSLCHDRFPEASRLHPWRTAIIRGKPHDANAWFFGSETGNAGLFATTEGVMNLAREALPGMGRLLGTRTQEWFWKNLTPWKASHRTVGYKRNSSWQTSGGPSLPRNAIGHNGFTGTSLWLDPVRSRGIILLTNRVHPQVPLAPFDRERRRFHRAVYRTLSKRG